MNIFRYVLPACIFIGAALPLKLRAADASAPAPLFQPRTGTFRLLEPDAAGKDPVVFVWETDYDPDWFKPYTGAAAAYKDFTGWVKARIDTAPMALLKRNRKLLKKEGKSTKRYDLILGGKLGNIRPMNRIEGELFLMQLERFGKPYEGEFLAFILRRADKLRIYGYETAKQTIKPGTIQRELRKDCADKWEYYANLHNHPFQFSGKNAPTGELIPSGNPEDGDVQFYLADSENLALQRAWITNGFDTIEIRAGEFPALAASPDR